MPCAGGPRARNERRASSRSGDGRRGSTRGIRRCRWRPGSGGVPAHVVHAVTPPSSGQSTRRRPPRSRPRQSGPCGARQRKAEASCLGNRPGRPELETVGRTLHLTLHPAPLRLCASAPCASAPLHLEPLSPLCPLCPLSSVSLCLCISDRAAPPADRRAWRAAPAGSWPPAPPGPAPRHDHEGRRIGRARRRAAARHQRVRKNAATTPTPTPVERQREAAPEHHAQHVARVRAERHADPDLVPPLAHEIGQHAVEADRRQHQRQRREQRQQPAGEPRRRDRRPTTSSIVRMLATGTAAIQLAHDGADRPGQRRRIAAGLDDQRHAADREPGEDRWSSCATAGAARRTSPSPHPRRRCAARRRRCRRRSPTDAARCRSRMRPPIASRPAQ